MASRRDELNAYNFARKRTVASFLKPLPNGSMESAPRPVRNVVPTIVLGVVILVGFGACGLIKPAAPKGWDDPGVNVIVGDQSTTRYVVLGVDKDGDETFEKKLLHPVLNLASARLLLKDPNKFQVVKVKESVLDGADALQHGATVGIPYAPDRLPSEEDARKKKTWALCERPSGGSSRAKAQRAVFVFSENDDNRKKLTSTKKGKLDGDQSLYVEDPDGKEYLVDGRGVAHPLDATFAARRSQPVSPAVKQVEDQLLRKILFGELAEPQKVTQEWMNSVTKSPLPIFLPMVDGVGEPSSTTGAPEEHRTVGKVLEANGEHYVVLKNGVALVSDFVAKLLLEGRVGQAVYDRDPKAVHVGAASVTANEPPFLGDRRKVPWPTEVTTQANTRESGDRVICSAYYGGDKQVGGESTGTREMSTWAGGDYPAPIADGSSSAYVSPGSGLLYKEVTGASADGSTFLLTDTGLRYSVPANNDSADSTGTADKDVNQSQIRLGYGGIASPALVPKEWSRLLSAGPSLDTKSASQPQGS
ncbi:type VII secretion protein EccB [Streptomyces sp. NPDC004647]|uniref:type VII secretion protein EccB n=1 Tax=Streptomyces sp. NPDC004647 TaxID=3154671 RepID=UPI0033B6A1DD